MKNLPIPLLTFLAAQVGAAVWWGAQIDAKVKLVEENRRYIQEVVCLLYTSPSPRDPWKSRMPSSA